MAVRVVRVRRGARLVDGGCVLSEILAEPGPTQCLFDVLAAAIAAFTPGARVLMLGFAGGGVLAPLRALGYDAPIESVELDPRGESVFRELCGSWSGEVTVHSAEAGAWLRRDRRRWDLIFEDLSVPAGGTITKPEVSLETLPALMRARLAPGGVAVTNVLPVPGLSWKDTLQLLAAPHPRARVVHFEDWENRLLIAGARLDSAHAMSRRLRGVLRALGSDQAERLALRRF